MSYGQWSTLWLSAIMPKLINHSEMLIKLHRTAIQVSNHMFSWSQNQFMKQDYVFGVLCAIWSTLWLLVIMLKHKNHPKTLIKLNRKVIQVSKICYHGQRIDFSHKVLFWMCHLHYGVHYDCRWLCRNMKFILKSFCKNLWACFCFLGKALLMPSSVSISVSR